MGRTSTMMRCAGLSAKYAVRSFQTATALAAEHRARLFLHSENIATTCLETPPQRRMDTDPDAAGRAGGIPGGNHGSDFGPAGLGGAGPTGRSTWNRSGPDLGD